LRCKGYGEVEPWACRESQRERMLINTQGQLRKSPLILARRRMIWMRQNALSGRNTPGTMAARHSPAASGAMIRTAKKSVRIQAATRYQRGRFAHCVHDRDAGFDHLSLRP